MNNLWVLWASLCEQGEVWGRTDAGLRRIDKMSFVERRAACRELLEDSGGIRGLVRLIEAARAGFPKDDEKDEERRAYRKSSEEWMKGTELYQALYGSKDRPLADPFFRADTLYVRDDDKPGSWVEFWVEFVGRVPVEFEMPSQRSVAFGWRRRSQDGVIFPMGPHTAYDVSGWREQTDG